MEQLPFRFGQPNLWQPPALAWEWGWYVNCLRNVTSQTSNYSLIMIGEGQKYYCELETKPLSDFIQSTLSNKGKPSSSNSTIGYSVSTFFKRLDRTQLSGYDWEISFTEGTNGEIDFLVTLTFPDKSKTFSLPEIEAKRLVNFLKEPFWSYGPSTNQVFTQVLFGADIEVGKEDLFWSFAYDGTSKNPFIFLQFNNVNGTIPIDINAFKNLVSFINNAGTHTPPNANTGGDQPASATLKMTGKNCSWTIGYPYELFDDRFTIQIEIDGIEPRWFVLTNELFGLCYQWFSKLPPPFHQDVL